MIIQNSFAGVARKSTLLTQQLVYSAYTYGQYTVYVILLYSRTKNDSELMVTVLIRSIASYANDITRNGQTINSTLTKSRDNSRK